MSKKRRCGFVAGEEEADDMGIADGGAVGKSVFGIVFMQCRCMISDGVPP